MLIMITVFMQVWLLEKWIIYACIAMPSNLRTKHRASETDEQREARLETVRVHTAQARSSETVEQREARLETARVRNDQACSSETVERRRRLPNE